MFNFVYFFTKIVYLCIMGYVLETKRNYIDLFNLFFILYKKDMLEERIFKKWSDTGFLQGLDEDLKMPVASEYEKMYRYILKKNITDDMVTTAVFPIINRIMRNSNIRDINCAEVLRLFDKEMAELMTITIANENAEMDLFAEACCCAAEEYIKLHG